MSDLNQAVEKFYIAHNEIFEGKMDKMDEIWSHSGDVTYMSPIGGILVGWDEVRDSWQKQADLNLHGHVEPIDTHVMEGDEIGVCYNYIEGTNYIQDGREVHPNIRATTVYRKEAGGWKVVSHHTDIMHWLEIEAG